MQRIITDIQRLLREDISAIQRWMPENKLTLNALKTEFILIASNLGLKKQRKHAVLKYKEKQYIGHHTLNRKGFI